mgnify:CR=1 FL=1|tara:strand:+ start:4533 stop:5486 length:954 start_codon:yes stop_codon:yes gene_type:complete
MASGNSSSRIIYENNSYIFEKSFPNRNVIQFYNEYFIHNYLSNKNQNFTAPIVRVDKKLLKIYYQYLKNTKLINRNYFKDYIRLIKSIHDKTSNDNNLKLYAKEALLDNRLSIKQIDLMLNKHKKNQIKTVLQKNYDEFIVKFDKALNVVINYLGKINPFSDLIFSHADSGLHNCALDDNFLLKLIDLEYSGLDSPIKQHIDFLLHPKNLKINNIGDIWTNYFINEKINKKDFINLNIYNAFFSLKWSLIIMNEFLEEKWQDRIFADKKRNINRDIILKNQLTKANIYLKASYKLLDNEKFNKLFTESEIILISKSY